MKLEQNYFRLLGLPQQYELKEDDFESIKLQSRKLQRQYHPDRIGSATPQEKQLAAQFSAALNSAVQSLKDPVLRAVHLLELSGVDTINEQYTIRDTQLLMEQMAFREELESAAQTKNIDGLKKLHRRSGSAFDGAQHRFARLFIDYPLAEELAPENHDAAKAAVPELQFYQKLDNEIRQAIATAQSIN